MNDLQVKERPILFSAPMVRAILEGRKTQTRRIVKLEGNAFVGRMMNGDQKRWPYRNAYDGEAIPCPFGQPGDRLWVRETFQQVAHFTTDESGETYAVKFKRPKEISYVADGLATGSTGMRSGWSSKKPAIHMPRWASRITLEIVNVRVERLQEIDAADAVAEGMPQFEATPPDFLFRNLWHTIHAADGPNGWNANPWVWVIEFRRLG